MMVARCTLCGVRDHALGGRVPNGEFMLAIPMETDTGGIAWPRLGSLGWCGNPTGEVHRLTIVRIELAPEILKGRRALVCQQCIPPRAAGQGIFTDLFTFAGGKRAAANVVAP